MFLQACLPASDKVTYKPIVKCSSVTFIQALQSRDILYAIQALHTIMG